MRPRALVVATVLAGCGGISGVKTPDTAQVSGRIAGAPFAAMSVTARYDATVGETVRLRDVAGGCDTNAAESHGFDLVLVDDSQSEASSVGGVYTVAQAHTRSRYATAEYATFVAGAPDGADEASSGAVDVTGNDGAELRGTFDLSFSSGAHVSGSFDAVTCAGSP